MGSKFLNMSTPAALAVRIVSDDEGTIDFVKIRGVEGVRFGSGSTLSRVVRPERFGQVGDDYASLLAWAKRFDANEVE